MPDETEAEAGARRAREQLVFFQALANERLELLIELEKENTELRRQLNELGGAIKPVGLLIPMETCPGESFSDGLVCDACGMTARHHRSEVYLRKTHEALMESIRENL